MYVASAAEGEPIRVSGLVRACVRPLGCCCWNVETCVCVYGFGALCVRDRRLSKVQAAAAFQIVYSSVMTYTQQRLQRLQVLQASLLEERPATHTHESPSVVLRRGLSWGCSTWGVRSLRVLLCLPFHPNR